MTSRTRFAHVLAGPLALLSLVGASCLPWDNSTSQSAFLEAEDVRVELPGDELTTRAQAEGDMVVGHVHGLVNATARDVNSWVTSIVEGAATVVGYLEGQPASAREGSVRIYGPYDDSEERDLSWLVRLDGDLERATYELWVGDYGATAQSEMELLLTGDLEVAGTVRSGGFTLDFDVVEQHPAMKSVESSLFVYAGSVGIAFERDVSSMKKSITIDFNNYEVLYQGFLDDDSFSSDETYVYRRDEDGGGAFHLALMGEWDDWNWSGPAQEEMILDMVWTPESAGRTRGQILETNTGDLKYGDLVVDECFGDDGYLTWRQINDEYLAEDPSYNFGDEPSCTLGAEDFVG